MPKTKSALEEISAKIAADPAPAPVEVKAEAEAVAVTAAVNLAPAAPAPAPVHTKPSLMDKAFNSVEFVARTWRVTLSEGLSISDALDPVFYRHVADKVMGHDTVRPKGRGDIIQVFKPDTSEFAELLIVEVGKGFIKPKLIRAVAADDVVLPGNCPFDIKWNASRQSHEVVRKEPGRPEGTVMVGGFQSRAGAAAWIFDHMKSMGVAA